MFSIIIISKNEEKCLPALLESIMRQKGRYEVILSDAQSKDNTRKIARKYGCRIVEGGLPSVGRNNGAKAAKYNRLLFLDSDIILPDNFLISLEKLMNEGVECGSPVVIPITNDLFIKFLYGFYNLFAKTMQHIRPFSGGHCIFSTKRVFKKINGFDESRLLSEDHDFITRASKVGKFKVAKDLKIYSNVRRITEEGKTRFVLKCIKSATYRIINPRSKKPEIEYVLHGTNESVTKIYERNK